MRLSALLASKRCRCRDDGFCSANRAENLCYRFTHGQKTPAAISQDCRLDGLNGKIQNFPCHVEPVETSSRKAHRGFCATLDPSTSLRMTKFSVAPETKTNSERTYTRNVQLRRCNTSRNGGEQISAEQDGCTSEQVRVVLCTCERVA